MLFGFVTDMAARSEVVGELTVAAMSAPTNNVKEVTVNPVP